MILNLGRLVLFGKGGTAEHRARRRRQGLSQGVVMAGGWGSGVPVQVEEDEDEEHNSGCTRSSWKTMRDPLDLYPTFQIEHEKST